MSITDNKWQKDKISSEEIAKDLLARFRELNPNFIDCDKHDNAKLRQHYFECNYQMLMKAHNLGAKTLIPVRAN